MFVFYNIFINILDLNNIIYGKVINAVNLT